MCTKIHLVLLFSHIFTLQTFAQVNWPQFRGESCGVVKDEVLPLTWDTKENVLWTADIPGRGWSCPIVWGDKIYLTTVASEGQVEEAKKGLYLGGNRNKPSTDTHHWIVYCFDWDSGEILWQKTVHIGKPAEPVHIKNTYASETPVTDGERVYVYFGNLGAFCFDLDGNELWRAKLDPVKMRHDWGTAASPVLHENKLFIVNDNEEDSYLLALNTKTGEEVFRIDHHEKSNWATPYIWQNSKRTELVTCGTNKVRSYDLEGNLLWELGPMSSIVIPTPVEHNDLLYICSGFVGDLKNRPIYAVRPGATGDISPDDNIPGEYIAWFHKTGGPYNPSPIAYGDYFYVLFDRGTVNCFESLSGKLVYEKQRLADDAKAFTASPWANDGKLFFLSEDGDTFVVQAGPEFKILGRNPLNEMCMATPATLRGRIIIRTLTKLYSIGE
ncbi:serine/threonine protein kinase [candidate division KSB1 bacterium]|nr:PQQ-binding-like beta-propeller repeat protein [candidate division KSB1 bacterium]RQW07206.1 MAG: serine/threonine protein kinase [candidate division KSB1 bacterium]